MQIQIVPAAQGHIDELEGLYNTLNDYLAQGVNYPGWVKGVYPTRADAERGLQQGGLYIAQIAGAIAGTVILNHRQEDAYYTVKWQADCDDTEAMVVHTLAVHPGYLHHGVGQALLDFAAQHAKERKMRSLRLDVYVNNAPAIRLYEKNGYVCVGTVDMKLGYRGLDAFHLYELTL
jgi:Acetyltransferases